MPDATSDGSAAGTTPRTPGGLSSGWRRWTAFVAGLATLILLARVILLPETNLALYWPAGGLAVVGVAAARNRRELGIVVATVLGVATLGNLVTGAPLQAAFWLGVLNAVLALTPAVWLAYAPGPLRSRHGGAGRPLGERLTVAEAPDLARLIVALLVGATTAALPGLVALQVLGAPITAISVTGIVVRLSVGAFVVAAPLLTLACVTGHGQLTTQPSDWAAWRTWLRDHAAEITGVLAFGTGLIALVYGPAHDLPLTYLPLIVSLWVGVRTPPAVAGMVTLWLGFLTAVLVLVVGGGPFADLTLSAANVMTVQGYAFLLVAAALVLSLVIAERDDLSDRLATAQRDTVARADDLGVITETVPVSLLVLSGLDEIEKMNARAEQLMRRLADAGVHGWDGWRRQDGTVVDPDQQPIARALRGETIREEILLEPAGVGPDTRAWSIDAVSLPARTDGAGRVLVTLRDVTEQQAHLASLESFAGIVAHDLQNPVSAVQGWTDIAIDELEDMAEAVDTAGLRSALDRVRGSTDRATALIKDLLDYSVGRTAAISKVIVDLDMMALAVTAGIEHAHGARQPKITIGSLGSVMGDPVLLSQVLTNLVGNAVKYTPPDRRPEVRIEARRTDHEVVIDVLDRGVGVPVSQQTAIFEPFTRAHTDDARFSGTGLGLAICAKAVQRHGGRISVVAREDGVGSRFTIVLPLAEPAEKPELHRQPGVPEASTPPTDEQETAQEHEPEHGPEHGPEHEPEKAASGGSLVAAFAPTSRTSTDEAAESENLTG